MMEEVQKELSITDEQKAELTKVMESLRPAGGPPGGFNREEFQKLSEEERAKKMDEFRKADEERAKKADESIKTLLKPEQFNRLSELRLQREGVRALSREEVQTQLGLTDEQKAKIKTLTEGQGQGFGSGSARGPRDLSEEERAKAREEMQARREAFDKGMAEVLTPEQKETWTKLQGAEFKFPQRGFGGGQGGGRRRRPE
jgi:Spy/CpxP family protein refolding chaperone